MFMASRFLGGFAICSLLILGACSSSSGTEQVSVVSIVQDLDEDPDGLVTVITFAKSAGNLTASFFEVDGDQGVESVTRDGAVYTVTWDARVTPSHQLRVFGSSAVSDAWRAVTSSDVSVVNFTISDGTQDTDATALGGDSFVVTFDGPNVIEALAEDPDNWTLKVSGTALDLDGSTIVMDTDDQTATFTLGDGANLHEDFSLAAASLTSVADVALATTAVDGTADGDATVPVLQSVVQNLDADEFGRVVDVTYDKAIDPVFGIGLSRFSVDDQPAASTTTLTLEVEQQSDPRIVRVTFSSCVVPGMDELELSGIVDRHGNAAANGTNAVTTSPVANGFDIIAATTVPGLENDTIAIVTDQALEPDTAEDPANWTLLIDGGLIADADMALDYDLTGRTLTITLEFDMTNGDGIDITGAGVMDIDGQAFIDNDNSAIAGGDTTGPAVSSARQNRTADSSGMTVDVVFDEDVEETTAETVANWSASGGLTVVSATRRGDGKTVRVVLDDVALPGEITLTALTAIEDPAGNDLGADDGPHTLTTSDAVAPAIISVTAVAVEGADNDTLRIAFDDSMYESDAEDDTFWTVESPTGTVIDVTGCTVVYNTSTMRATMTLDAGDIAIKAGDDVTVTLNTMRDVGGNAIDGNSVTDPVAAGETRLPSVHFVFLDSAVTNAIEVWFDEPCDELLDLYDVTTNPEGTRYALRDDDAGQTLLGYPTSTGNSLLQGGLGVRLTYGFVISTDHTVDILGFTDLAGNYGFPSIDTEIAAEDGSAPALDVGVAAVVAEGELNDFITVEFDRDMSPWNITSGDHYTLTSNPGAVDVDLSRATISFDGSDTVTIKLGAGATTDLQNASNYDVTVDVDADNPLRTVEGVALAAQDMDTVAAAGDGVAPTQADSTAVLDTADANSLLVIFDEAVDQTAAEDETNYDYNGGTVATSVDLISPRVARVTFGSAVAAGNPLVITAASATDLAGNTAAGDITLTTAADTTAPLLSTVTGTIVPGIGGDQVSMTWNEQLDIGGAIDISNFVITNGGTVDLSGASITWSSPDASVTISLADGIELDAGSALSVSVTTLADAAGNALSGTIGLGGAISGDTTAPDFSGGFVNWREDSGGLIIDVLFTEDVDETYAGDPANWTASGGQTVVAVTMVSGAHARIELDADMGSNETLDITALEDLAHNISGDISIDPEE